MPDAASPDGPDNREDAPSPVTAEKRRARVGFSTRVLESPVYRRIWLSGFLFSNARLVEIVISGWIVLTLTNSPLLLTLTGVFRILPMLLFGSVFGALGDRFARVNILLGIHVASLVASLLLAATFLSGADSLLLVYPAIFVLGAGTAADFSARAALIDEVQERSLLANAMSLESLSMSFSKITAGLVAGYLLSTGGAGLAYAYLAALYGVGLLWMISIKRRLPARPDHEQAVRVVTAPRSGWASALQLPVVRGVFFVTIIINILVFPYQQLLAIVANDILSVGPFLMGLLTGADGVGGVLTAAVLTFGSGARRPGALFFSGAIGAAAMIVGLALSPIFALSLAIQFAYGICTGLFGAHQAALVLSASPPESRARSLGLIATAIGLTPIGMLLIGTLSTAAGAQVTMASMASLGFIGLVIVLIFNPQLRAARIG